MLLFREVRRTMERLDPTLHDLGSRLAASTNPEEKHQLDTSFKQREELLAIENDALDLAPKLPPAAPPPPPTPHPPPHTHPHAPPPPPPR